MDKFQEEAEKAMREIENSGLDTAEKEQLPEELLGQIEYFKSIDPKFTESQEYKDLIAQSSSQAPKSKASNEEATSEDEDDYEEEEEDEDDIFGIKKPSTKKKEVEIDFEVPAEFKTILKDRFEIEDPKEFFENAEKWKQDALEKEKFEKGYNEIVEDLGSMPTELKEVIEAWAKGEDHTKFFQDNKRLNYSESFDKQDKERLVQHYLPEEFTELQEDLDAGDISKEEYEKQLRLLSRTTKRLFSDEKDSISKERERMEDKEKQHLQNLKVSAKDSVETLRQSFPNFKQEELRKINAILVERSIDELFLDEDGKYNKDAATKLAFALYGNKIVDSVKGKAERQGESKANMKIVDSSPKALRKSKTTQGTEKADLKEVEHLTSMFKKDPYL